MNKFGLTILKVVIAAVAGAMPQALDDTVLSQQYKTLIGGVVATIALVVKSPVQDKDGDGQPD